MPRFNSRGQVGAGVGDGIVSIDGVEVARGGFLDWIDDDRMLLGGHWTDEHGAVAWRLLCYDQRTKQTTKLADCEVNFGAASGGEYFAVGATNLAASFPIASQALRLTPASTDNRGAGDRHGTIALSDLTGQGFTLRAKDGSEVRGAAGFPCYGLTVVSPTQALWPANGGFATLNLPPIKTAGAPGRGCYCVVDGRPWVVYYLLNVGLVAHPADDASRVLIIESAPIFFHYDAIVFNRTIRVTYATTAAEAPNQIVDRYLDLSRLAPLSVPAPVPIPAPLPKPTPEPVPMPYQSQAPDLSGLLAELTAKHPIEWAEAYEYAGHDRTDRFVKLAAKAAHKVDPRFGLNGKRGGDVLSLDVLAFKNSTVPAANGGVELIDFIYDNGAPGAGVHRIQWSDATLPNVAGKWIDPGEDDGTPGETEDPPAANVGDFTAAAQGLEAVIADLASMVLTLRRELAAQQAEIEALKARPVGGNVTGIVDGAVIALRSHTEGREYLTAEAEAGGRVVTSTPGRAFGGYQLWTVEVQQ